MQRWLGVLRPAEEVQHEVQHFAADAAEAHEQAGAVVGPDHKAAAVGVLQCSGEARAGKARWQGLMAGSLW